MSLWDTLLIPADKLQQLRADAAADRPTHAWLLPGRPARLTVRRQRFSPPLCCASNPTRRTAGAASARVV